MPKYQQALSHNHDRGPVFKIFIRIQETLSTATGVERLRLTSD